ncbi:MAG: type IV pilus twitching motility protein PilT [Planctomycetota bacterium]
MELETLLKKAANRKASDILISAGSPPCIRIDGVLRYIVTDALTPAETKDMVYGMLEDTQRARFERERELDFSITYQGNRFRGNAYWKLGTVAAALRLIPTEIPEPQALGLPPKLLELIEKPHGLILITGATGQGKSTSMASLIAYVNRTHRRHIITIEDPVEFLHRNEKSVVDQREVGPDTLGFSEALKHVLRQNPDVIQVGEMRDLETIRSALTAAETGHLVISTLHTNDAVQAIDRIIDVFPRDQQGQIRAQLSMVLLAVFSQRLVKGVTGSQILAYELLVGIPSVGHLIRDEKSHQLPSLMQLNQREGMVTLDHCLKELVKKGAVSETEAARFMSGNSGEGEEED